MKSTLYILLWLFLLSSSALQSQNAPVTKAESVTDAIPGDPSVPVAITVTQFNNIAQFTLTMKFDTTRVRFVSASTNPLLSGMTIVYTSPVGNTQGKLVLTWTSSSNISLADGSSIANLTFHYITGTGILSWAYTFGSVCQYKRIVNTVMTTLSDSPKYLFYKNGGISNRVAPVTFVSSFPDPAPGPLPVSVIVNGFDNVGALTLYLEYDSTVIHYLGTFTKNPVFISSFLVGNNIGSGGKKLMVIQWFGDAVNLDDGDTLCTLNFSYPSANCQPCFLNWYDNNSSCEYTDAQGNVLIDMPQADYYINGLVAEGLPAVWTGNIGNAWDNPANWSDCGTPNIRRRVIIPDVSPKAYPVITDSGYCKSIIIETGAMLTVGPNGSIAVGDN
jgi:hypothetical protein